MSLRVNKRIALGGLMVGGAIFGVMAWLFGPTSKTNTPVLTNSSRDVRSPSKAAFDERLKSICATGFTVRDNKLHEKCQLEEMRRRFFPQRSLGPVVIKVYFHILRNEAGEGAVPEQAIRDQINVLNVAFAGDYPGGVSTPFQFELADFKEKTNDVWFDMEYSELDPTQAERDAKSALNKPGNATLNIYTARVEGTLGWARWPWQLGDNVDGVVVKFSTLPGMAATHRNNLGDVVVHEVGHWLGLFHTAEGGCDPPGDCVDDTAAEATSKTGCDRDDSCRDDEGQDEYWNYMNHTDDKCKYVFTSGQVARMVAIYRKFRA